MASRNADMQAIFSELSEKNKDIVILIAKSVKVAQEVAEQPLNLSDADTSITVVGAQHDRKSDFRTTEA